MKAKRGMVAHGGFWELCVAALFSLSLSLRSTFLFEALPSVVLFLTFSAPVVMPGIASIHETLLFCFFLHLYFLLFFIYSF